MNIVNNNNNNMNNGNGGNNGCSYKVIDNSRCAESQRVKFAASSLMNKDLTWWNTQYQARVREAAIGMSWTDFKALLIEELCPSNEMEKLENKFWNHKIVGANHTAYTNRFHELAKLVPHLVTPESSRIKRYIAGLAPEIRGMLRATQPTIIQSAILRAGILTDEAVSYGTLTNNSYTDERVCYECGSPDHLRNTCPQMQRAPGQAGNSLALEGNLAALQDPNVMTGTFSLNDHFATALFDSGADFSFISTNFVPLLNMKPSFVNPGYVIEVANGKKVKVDRII
ncbi:putative reverse transcriptase domain-containing protein, partial [Tanacetum coccineum]